MVIEIKCPACMNGMHDRHIQNFDRSMPGLIGGTVCSCKGDCARERDESVQRLIAAGLFAIAPGVRRGD